MPHLRILYKEEKVNGDILNNLVDELIGVVAKHFNENPKYVSADIISQSKFVRNRKDVDLELDASPDSAGQRSEAACDLSLELGKTLQVLLKKRGVNCEVSSWVRIFSKAEYAYIEL